MPLKTRLQGAIRDGSGAWVFYSVLPAWPGIQPRFERIARFAPLVGLVLGLVQALFWWLTSAWLPLVAQVSLVIVLGILLTGGLHLDGAMDAADGLAAGPRALEAMQDSRVGASGAQALALVLLLKVAALASLAQAAPVALLWAALWGRVAPLFAMATFPYLRPEGGSAAFHRSHWRGLARELRPALVGAALLLAGLVWAGAAPAQLWMGVLAGLPALLVPLGLGRRLGGHSGDTYGACVEWTEALALLLCGLMLRLLGLEG